MLAKKHRLNLSLKENSSIFKKGESNFSYSKFFLVHSRINSIYLRLSCLTPKATLNTASKRNEYRRLLYSFVENEILENNLSLSLKRDVVIILKKNFLENKEILEKDFKKIVNKINENK